MIGDKAPVAPDPDQTSKYRQPSTVGPTLSRTSLQAPLQRTSLAPGSGANNSGNNSPQASRPALARVSAHEFPNLSRASQLSTEAKRAAAAGLRRSSVVKAQQEAARRAEAPTEVTATVTIVDDDTGNAVTFKNDGQRFRASKYTVKLVQGHSYKFRIAFGEEVSLPEDTVVLTYMNTNKSLVKDLIECERVDKGVVGSWTCKAAPSEKGGRNSFELAMHIQDFGECRLPFNVKVYPSKKTRAVAAGMPLKTVILKYIAAGEQVKLKTESWVDH